MVVYYLCSIRDLMQEWSAFNGQGSWSVYRIWQLLLFYYAVTYLDLLA